MSEEQTTETRSIDLSKVDMKYLVRALVKYNASDLHIKVGRPPLFRINGRLVPAKVEALEKEHVERIVYDILTDKQREKLEEGRQVDLSFRVKDLGRFRCNVYFQRDTVSAAIRMIPLAVPSFEGLGIPSVLKDLVHRPRGLLLVTGSTGSGKSTTLAALVQHINESRAQHVLTIEDPIEFVHRDLKSSITQREVGSDINSLYDGLLGGLRQDTDVMVIGELRGWEMVQGAITAAETGRLVLATLHSTDARGTIERVLDSFPPEGQNQARIQLSSVLIGVVWQQLIMRADGSGRVPACEVMIKSPAIESYIFKNQMDKISEAVSGSSDYYQMQSMNQALEKLVRAQTVQLDEALKVSPSPDDLKLRLAGIQRDEGYEMAQSWEDPDNKAS
jgi:twitching motility protein PilT